MGNINQVTIGEGETQRVFNIELANGVNLRTDVKLALRRVLKENPGLFESGDPQDGEGTTFRVSEHGTSLLDTELLTRINASEGVVTVLETKAI